MNIEIIDAIAAGFTSNIGNTIIASIFLFVAVVFLFSTVLNIEPLYAIMMALVPFMVMVTSLSFYVSWAMGLVTLFLGLILSFIIYRLFVR